MEVTMSKEEIIAKKEVLIKMLTEYCQSNLDEEYEELCLKMVEKMSRKRTVPFISGRIDIWAASIVYAIGQINFLFDRSFEPYQSADDICKYFGTTKSSTSQKAKIIRDMFKLGYFDKDFSTKKVGESNPLKDIVEYLLNEE